MKSLSIQKTILSLALAIILFGAAIADARQASASTSHKRDKQSNMISEQNDEWAWRRTADGVGIEVKLRGVAQFKEDYTDILTLSDGGWLRIKDERNRVTRRLEVTPNSSGSLGRSYSVNGETRPYDEEARQWLAALLMEAVRQAGLDATNRAQKILTQRGPAGVLEEISLIKSDHVKGLYFRELFKATTLDSASVQQALREVSKQMSSNHAKAQVMMVIAESYLNDDATRSAYLTAVGTIDSDYERGRVLSALLKKSDLSEEILTHTLRTAAAISSDYEKARLLIAIASGMMKAPALRHAYLETTGTIGSNYEKARVLLELLKRKEMDQDSVLQAIKSATEITSDYEKARVLLQVAGTHSGDERIRTALTDAARTISSEYERGRVLSATHR